MPQSQGHVTQKDCCSRQEWTCKNGFKAFLHPHYLTWARKSYWGISVTASPEYWSNSWFITLLFLHTRGWSALAEDERISHFWAHHTITACETVPQLGAAPHTCTDSSVPLAGLQGRRALRATTDFGHHWFLDPQCNGPKTQFLQHSTFHKASANLRAQK